MKNYFLVCIGLILVLVMLGCEMSKGAGKDLEKAGKSIQSTVEKNQ